MPDATLDRIPSGRLGQFPTPLQEAPRLSAAAGIPIWLKRDDLTGVGLGGNKVRALEFLLGAALDDGCDVLVTGSGPQSNWAMLAALAARRCGLATELCFYGTAPEAARGNLLLHDLTGARITWTGTKERASVDLLIEQTADRLVRQGRGGAVRAGAGNESCTKRRHTPWNPPRSFAKTAKRKVRGRRAHPSPVRLAPSRVPPAQGRPPLVCRVLRC